MPSRRRCRRAAAATGPSFPPSLSADPKFLKNFKNFLIFFKIRIRDIAPVRRRRTFALFGGLAGLGEVGNEVVCGNFRRFSNGRPKCGSEMVLEI